MSLLTDPCHSIPLNSPLHGAQAYSERLVSQTGVMVVSGAMFDDDSASLRIGFAKANFAARLAAWAETFATVPLPGRMEGGMRE